MKKRYHRNWSKEIAAIVLTCLVFAYGGILPKSTYAAENKSVPTVKGLQVIKVSEKQIALKWKPVKNVRGYAIFRVSPGSKKYKKVKTISNGKTTKWTNKKLKSGKVYKYKIAAIEIKNGKKRIGKKSYCVSSITASKKSKKTNVKAVKATVTSIKLSPTQKKTAKVRLVPKQKKKKLISSKKIWTSSNKCIVTVNGKGKITPKQEGTCFVYCRAHNGKRAKIKVTVQDHTKYAKSVPILTFHRIVPEEIKNEGSNADNEWIASVDDFAQQMKFLHDDGYTTISADQFYEWHQNRIQLPKKTAMLTFDDGDYELYYLVLPILKQYGFKATAFVIGNETKATTHGYEKSSNRFRIGQDLIAKVQKEYPALEFQSHSYGLHMYRGNDPIVYTLNLDQLRQDFKDNEEFGFRYLAYPYGAETPELITAFNESGMKMGFGFKQRRNATRKDPVYDIPRVKINGQISLEQFKAWMRK